MRTTRRPSQHLYQYTTSLKQYGQFLPLRNFSETAHPNCGELDYCEVNGKAHIYIHGFDRNRFYFCGIAVTLHTNTSHTTS